MLTDLLFEASFHFYRSIFEFYDLFHQLLLHSFLFLPKYSLTIWSCFIPRLRLLWIKRVFCFSFTPRSICHPATSNTFSDRTRLRSALWSRTTCLFGYFLFFSFKQTLKGRSLLEIWVAHFKFNIIYDNDRQSRVDKFYCISIVVKLDKESNGGSCFHGCSKWRSVYMLSL